MIRTIAAAVFALLTVTAPAHAATVTWDVDAAALSGLPGIPPSPTWTVTGSFAFNPTLQTISDFNISAAGFPTITPFTLNPLNAQVTISNNLIFQTTNINFQNTALGQDVFFQTSLTDFGDTNQGVVCFQPGFQPCPRGVGLDQFSSVGFDNGSRFFLQGALEVATPLPDTLPMFGAALLALGGFAAWRSRRAVRG